MSKFMVDENLFKIEFTEDEINSIREKAELKSKKYEILNANNSKATPYGFNNVHSHLVGLVCEYGAHRLFEEVSKMCGNFSIDPVYLDESRDGEADIIINNIRIEVKGMKSASWAKFGPCINIKQKSSIERKSDIVLFAVFHEKKRRVEFRGYINTSDINNVKPIRTENSQGKRSLNFPVISELKDVSTLTL